MRKLVGIFLFLFNAVLLTIYIGCNNPSAQESSTEYPDFTFAFLTDIHVQPESNAIKGFKKAIQNVNDLKPDFVITGGDLIMDALGVSYGRADSLYRIYDSLQGLFNMPVYNTLGNHEVFGIYKSAGIDTTHELFGKKMFEERIGPRYYSFNYDNWHFIVLDAIGITPERQYKGEIDQKQIKWIINDLEKIDRNTPVVVCVHIPFVTAAAQIEFGPLSANGGRLVIMNNKEVLELFSGYNLKLVLQGHVHLIEDIFYNNIHFVTGGAVSANWWLGKHFGTEEGFLMVKVKGDEFEWDYIDFGWEVQADK